MWQPEADSVSFMSTSSATAVGQILLEYGILFSEVDCEKIISKRKIVPIFVHVKYNYFYNIYK